MIGRRHEAARGCPKANHTGTSQRQDENFFAWAGSPTYPSPGGVRASLLLGAGYTFFSLRPYLRPHGLSHSAPRHYSCKSLSRPSRLCGLPSLSCGSLRPLDISFDITLHGMSISFLCVLASRTTKPKSRIADSSHIRAWFSLLYPHHLAP